jgi:hypothetical protein
MKRLTVLLIGLAAAPAGWSAQPVGRLFFTPAERAALDAARVQKPTPQAAAAPQEPPRPTSQTITYSGIVRRSDGKSTLWLNNKAVDEKDALSSLAVTGRVRADGAVTLQVPETGASIDLKVGQRAELQTGRVAEARRDKGDSGAAKKDDAPKGEPPNPDEAKAEPARTKGAEREAAERKAEAPPGSAAAARDGISQGDPQQRAKAR